MLLFTQPRIWLAFWCASAHCRVIFNVLSTNTLESFSAGLLSIRPLVCTDTGNFTNPGSGPCTCSCWASQCSHWPTSSVSQSPSGWHLFPLTYQLHHSAWCHSQTFSGCTSSHYVIDEYFGQYWTQYRPLRYTISHWSPCEHWAMDCNSLDAVIQPIPYALRSPSIKCLSLHLATWILCETVLKPYRSQDRERFLWYFVFYSILFCSVLFCSVLFYLLVPFL